MQCRVYRPIIHQTDFFNDCCTFGTWRMRHTLLHHITTHTHTYTHNDFHTAGCVNERNSVQPIVQFTMYWNIFSFRIFGNLVNYTFLETLWPTESEKQCLHFFQASYGSHLGFSKWRLFFLKSSNISASNYPIHMILVSKDAFLRSRNPVGQLKRC